MRNTNQTIKISTLIEAIRKLEVCKRRYVISDITFMKHTSGDLTIAIIDKKTKDTITLLLHADTLLFTDTDTQCTICSAECVSEEHYVGNKPFCSHECLERYMKADY